MRPALDTVAQRLADLGALKPGERDRAGDVFWYLFGWTSWRALIIEPGWSWDQAEQWVARRVEALLNQESPTL